MLGETSGLADDRVFAELFRMAPFGSSVAKGIVPYAVDGLNGKSVIGTNGATGSIVVRPFRALIGSQTAEGTEARKCWRDIRSGLSVSVGATTMNTVIALAANSSGNPRVDLIYATVVINAQSAPVTRKVKDITSLVVSALSVSTELDTTVTVGAVTGTPGASPVWPSLPADSGSTYHIPLGYIAVPNGFTSGSTVKGLGIASTAPVVALSRATGASKITVADQQYVISSLNQARFGSLGFKPSWWMPPDMSGGDQLLVAIQLNDNNTASTWWSHQDQGVVDSRDWRGRICKGICYIYGTNAGTLDIDFPSYGEAAYPWAGNLAAGGTTQSDGLFSSSTGTSGIAYKPHLNEGSATNVNTALTVGQTISPIAVSGYYSPSKSIVAQIDGNDMDPSQMAASTKVTLYCDFADSGKLKVHIEGKPTTSLFFWLDFSGVYSGNPSS